MNLALWLQRAALRWPEAPALLEGTSPVADYRAFASSAGRVAKMLRERFGFGPGDRLAVWMPNSTDYLILLYGAWYAGGVVVPINAKLHPREAAWIAVDSGARVIFAEAADVDELGVALSAMGDSIPIVAAGDGDELAASTGRADPLAPCRRGPDDLAWLFYTSGTTGKPKGVMLSHGNLQAMALTYLADVDDVSRQDAALYAAPMSHGAGMYNFTHILQGARHVVPESRGFDADEILALAPQLGRVSMFAAPTMVSRLTRAARDSNLSGEGIKTIVYGGGPMYLADLEDALDVLGPRLVQIYGQGECPMTITALARSTIADRADPAWAHRAASVGLAQSCVEIQVAGADGEALPSGEVGEVLVRGAPVMLGYWNRPDESRAALRGGWLWTGDVGVLDGAGYLTLKDRSKDLIISGGSNIYPREVEEALLAHPLVREAAVIGAPDPEWGEKVVAFVVVSATVSAADLDSHCLSLIARFKRPKHILFVDELPKNNYGKILKTALRERLAMMQSGEETSDE